MVHTRELRPGTRVLYAHNGVGEALFFWRLEWVKGIGMGASGVISAEGGCGACGFWGVEMDSDVIIRRRLIGEAHIYMRSR